MLVRGNYSVLTPYYSRGLSHIRTFTYQSINHAVMEQVMYMYIHENYGLIKDPAATSWTFFIVLDFGAWTARYRD